MNTSKKISLGMLGITAVLCSRGLFSLFNDPEGPNLLIVMVTAAGIYIVSLIPFQSTFSVQTKVLIAIGIQMLLTAIASVALR